MQLVAYGAQDIYITGNPQITFFKIVYRRHTNFSMESIEQTWNGTADFDQNVTSIISRNGDLIHKMYLETDISNLNAAANVGEVTPCANLGSAFISSVELEIGGQRIDKHYGHWLETWSELTEKNDLGIDSSLTHKGLAMVKRSGGTKFQLLSGMGGVSPCNNFIVRAANIGQYGGFAAGIPWGLNNMGTANRSIPVGSYANATGRHIEKMWVPLQFWFCRNVGLALPLIALQYHEVKIKLEIAPRLTLFEGSNAGTCSPKLWVDYIYLDTDERRRFAQVSHEYLIEQLQYQSTNNNIDADRIFTLNFNHPVKELIWVGKGEDIAGNFNIAGVGGALHAQGPTTFRSIGVIPDTAANARGTAPTYQLKLNGHERFTKRDYRYFSRAQVNDFHSGYGGIKINKGHKDVENGFQNLRTSVADTPSTYSILGHRVDVAGNPLGGAQAAGAPMNSSHSMSIPNFTLDVLAEHNEPIDSIGVYSFALKPEEHQPSGSCNFSRIDNAQLIYTINDGLTGNLGKLAYGLHIYAVNYNILRIMSGMGGLAYSN